MPETWSDGQPVEIVGDDSTLTPPDGDKGEKRP